MLELKDFVYDVANTKSYGHVMVNINNWESTNLLTQINMSGKLLPTCMTKVVKINPAPAYRPVPFKAGDTVALSNIATRIGVLKPFQLPDSSELYANVHLSQILGYFTDSVISIDNFTPLYDKVVMKKIEVESSNLIAIVSDSMSVGEVIAVGSGGFDDKWNKRPMNVKVGDEVLIRDNVTTTICIDGEEYYITDDTKVMGRFLDKNYDIDSLVMYDENYSIFEEYADDRIAGSFLYRPVLSDDDDIARSYEENTFKLVKSSLFDKGIYFMSRFDTEYIRFKSKQYFVIKNDKVMAKAKGDDNGRFPN